MLFHFQFSSSTHNVWISRFSFSIIIRWNSNFDLWFFDFPLQLSLKLVYKYITSLLLFLLKLHFRFSVSDYPLIINYQTNDNFFEYSFDLSLIDNHYSNYIFFWAYTKFKAYTPSPPPPLLNFSPLIMYTEVAIEFSELKIVVLRVAKSIGEWAVLILVWFVLICWSINS